MPFEQGAARFYFALGSANFIAGPAFLYLTFRFSPPPSLPCSVCNIYHPFIDLDF